MQHWPVDVLNTRLLNQRLAGGRFSSPDEVVRWLGAVQAQEYPDAKWALGMRMRRARDATIERAVTAGAILRTHVLRPTWHFVVPADIRWMLALTGPHISQRMTPYNRRLELDATVFRRSRNAIVRALRDGAQLTRQELKAVLQHAGVQADGVQRLAHIVMQAEIEGVICNGARRGRHHTYALLDDRVPPTRALTRDEALAELARRYFTSHGPAQIPDFAWWSGLAMSDARAGLALAERDLARDTVRGTTYWFSTSVPTLRQSRTAYLLPLYDEYLIAYKDRSAALDLSRWKRVVGHDPFSAPIVVGGKVVGGWRRAVKEDRIAVSLTPFEPLNKRDTSAVADAAGDYGEFVGMDLELSWQRSG